MPVTPSYGDWLQSEALYVSVSDATLASRWPTQAIESEGISPLADPDDADDEGERQIAFLGPPKDVDLHVVPGQQRGVVGCMVTLTIEKLGYEDGVDCFVLGADENQVPGCTVLTVLRRM